MRRPTLPRRRDERGYVAVTTGLLLLVLMAFCAFAVDVGNWYLTGQRAQRAADAAALGGVTKLPGDQPAAFSIADQYASGNGFRDDAVTSVTPSLGGGPTRLRVEVTRTVDNIFGPLLGVPETTVSRFAVADYAGPVPLGSPCNRFGDDPEPGSTGSGNCSDTGQFWANVGSPGSNKVTGDAFQNNRCTTEDGCTGGRNRDYDANGHVFTVTLREPVNNLTIEAYDPAQVVVGDYCTLASANLPGAAALPAARTVVSNPAARYARGAGPWCTGDQPFNTGLVRTEFTVRSPGANPWQPTSWPAVGGCTQVFEPFSGDLAVALDTSRVGTGFRPDVAENFRRWVPLCTIPGTTPAGTYAIQVRTNGLGADAEGGHNRFGLRAFGSGSDDKDAISIAGFGKMVMYGNTPNGTSRFFLARIPSSSGGQTFKVNLFDIGDGATAGSHITVRPPDETGGSFSGCVGQGVANGALSNCRFNVSGAFNGKWQTVTVPVPASYTCDDASPAGCWVRLEFFYGPSSSPADTTSWQASVDGDPIRLVE
ncbi:MAG: pilus assembly protein TadG-related protein [Phycicoccus sp.]